MPVLAGTPTFTSGTFAQSELLKIIQENGSKVLWKEVDGLDAIVKKNEWPWGKEVRYSLTVDAGGGAFSGIDLNGGMFAPGDKVSSLVGVAVPKFQTFTMQFERFMDKMTKSQTQAYVNSMKLEFDQKTMFQKSFMNVQMLGDGTGRIATPVGIGPSDDAVGVSRTVDLNGGGAAATSCIALSANTVAAGNAANLSPIKIKMSSLDTAVGDVAHLVEGSVVSFYFADYDSNNDGTVDLVETTAVPRLLILGFGDGQAADTAILAGAANMATYDAFRVVKIEQENDAIYVMPGRVTSKTATTTVGAYTTNTDYQSASWLPGVTLAGALYCFPIAGLTAAYGTSIALTYGTATAKGFTNIFAPAALTTAVYLVHPLYIPNTLAMGRAMLGLGWVVGTTDITQINPYIATGLETLVMERRYVVHGVNRNKVLQYLPTVKDIDGANLKFNTFFTFLAEHFNRNRSMETDWSILPMNPIVYTSMVSQSEQQRVIIDGKGIRGEDGAKLIKFGGKTYQLEMNTTMRKNRIYLLPKNCIEMYGGTIEKVDVNGQSSFLTLVNGRRVNVIESYNTVQVENVMRSPREAGAIRGFNIISL